MILYPEIYYVLPCFESTNDYEGSFLSCQTRNSSQIKIIHFFILYVSDKLTSQLTSDLRSNRDPEFVIHTEKSFDTCHQKCLTE